MWRGRCVVRTCVVSMGATTDAKAQRAGAQVPELSEARPHFCSNGCCSTVTLPASASGSSGRQEHRQTDLGRLQAARRRRSDSRDGAC